MRWSDRGQILSAVEGSRGGRWENCEVEKVGAVGESAGEVSQTRQRQKTEHDWKFITPPALHNARPVKLCDMVGTRMALVRVEFSCGLSVASTKT